MHVLFLFPFFGEVGRGLLRRIHLDALRAASIRAIRSLAIGDVECGNTRIGGTKDISVPNSDVLRSINVIRGGPEKLE